MFVFFPRTWTLGTYILFSSTNDNYYCCVGNTSSRYTTTDCSARIIHIIILRFRCMCALETISKALCNQCIVWYIICTYTWYIFLPIYYMHIVYAVFYGNIIYDGDDTLENHRVPPLAGSNNNYYTGAHIIIIIIIVIIIRFFFVSPTIISVFNFYPSGKKTKDPMARGPNAFARNF